MKNKSFDEVFFPKRKLKKLLLIMRLSALFLMILSLNLTASVYSQNTRFTVDLNGKTVREVFQFIEQQSEFRFFYNDDFSYIDKVVDMNVKNENVEQILEKLFESSDITYKVFDNNLVVLTLKQSLQQVEIKGLITDAVTNEALPGANVQVKGTTKGTTTNMEGKYSIGANQGETLVFSFIGYLPQEVAVEGQTTIDISLQPDVQSLEEVVVVGYGTQKKLEVTGAVTSVNSEEITSLPVTSATQALQGRATGVTVINNGSPGTAPTVRIRGIGTTNNNDPLYIIDGVVATGMGDLNPSDIESVQILKDASTTAVYGAKGSNGVVLIQTKGGKAGKVTVTLDGYVGTQFTNKRFDVMNTEQYIAYASDTLVMGSDKKRGNLEIPAALRDAQYSSRISGETDWQDEVFQSGGMQNYNLGISGGGENSSYRLSAGYLNQEGILIHTGYERYNFRANSNFDVGRKINVGQTLSLSFGLQRPEPSSGGRSILEHCIKMAPYLPVYNPDNLGGYQGPNTAVDGQDAENPVRILSLNKFRTNTVNILGSVFAEYEILKGLKYKIVLGLEDVTLRDNQFLPSFDDDNLGGTHRQTYALIRHNIATYQSFLMTNSLNYSFTLADKHNFELLAVAERSSIDKTLTNSSSQNAISDDVEQLSPESDNITSTLTEYERIGYLGRLNYNFDQKYMLAASVRRDASSRFGENQRWGTFPSVAAGWNIHREAFMTNLAMVSNLKVRGSWGKSGNDNIGEYAYKTTITSVFTYPLGGSAAIGATPSGLPNPDLKWEETTMTNIGLDLGLLRNQFTLSAEYYIRKSDDLLMPRTLAGSLGIHSGVKMENVGSVEANGFELELGYNDYEGAFQWQASLNLGTSKNELKDLGATDQLSITQFENEPITRCTVGEPLFYFYGWKTAGVFEDADDVAAWPTQSGAQPGDIRIVDVAGIDANGNRTGPDGKIDANDRTKIGNPFPKMTLGFNLNASYMGFDLNLFVSGSYGNDIYNTNIYDLQGMPRLFNAGTDVLRRWTPSNTKTDVPRASGAATNIQVSDRFVEDGSFTRLKNVTLGYTLPESLIKNRIQKCRIYVSGQNLLTLTDYSGLDPEIGVYTVAAANASNIGSPVVNASGQPIGNFQSGIDYGTYPIPKSVIVGVQITF
ncbi:MAG TPA: TonB-dependent receptor [Bacteroidales bacterium]|jgi:TonB-linked SusC/RagA family outer membrane protein|nr:TonB-dependent receptor [Bacteroidales bacterium]